MNWSKHEALNATSMPRMSPRIAFEWLRFEALTAVELYELLRFRQGIFVVEQCSPYPDLDALDQGALHLVARVDKELAGYLRLIPTIGPPLVRIGRVAVSPPLRRQGLGRRLMEEALLFCHQRYSGQPIALSAQLHLVPFYENFGFVATSDPYDDFGVAHVEMALQPPAKPGAERNRERS